MKWQCWLVALGVGLLLGSDVSKESGKKELDKLQGTWVGTGGQAAGNDFDDDTVKTMKLVVAGDKYTFTLRETTEKGTLKLDPTKKLKTMDIEIADGMDQGKKQLAIYSLDKDTLKICFAPAGKEDRPKEFSAKEDEETGIFSFKRQR